MANSKESSDTLIVENRHVSLLMASSSIAELDDAVFNWSNGSGFTRCRIWDVLRSELTDSWKVSLRHKNHSDGPDIGEVLETDSAGRSWVFKNEVTTLPKSLKQGYPLDLVGRYCFNVSVFQNGAPISLYCFDCEDEKELNVQKQHLETLQRMLEVKIDQLWQKEINRVVSQQIELEASDTGELLFKSLSFVGEALKCQYIAVFNFNTITGSLHKSIELQFSEKGEPKRLESKLDSEYQIGSFLTGRAWTDENLHYVPDFDSIPEHKLSNPESIKLHGPIHSVLYGKIELPGGGASLVRVMNRIGGPDKRFGRFHSQLFQSTLKPIAQQVASLEYLDNLESIWETTKRVLKDIFSKQPLSITKFTDVLMSVGIDRLLLVRIDIDGVVVEAELFGKDHKKWIPESELKIAELDDLPVLGSAGEYPEALEACLTDFGFSQAIVINGDTPHDNDFLAGSFLVILPTVINPQDSSLASSVTHEWHTRQRQLAFAKTIAKLVGISKFLERNKQSLRDAEEAVGVIGHEGRSPAASLTQLAKEMSSVTQKVLDQIVRDLPIDVPVGEQDQKGVLKIRHLENSMQVKDWLRRTNRKIDTDSERLSRVITDAMKWARTNTRQIECNFGDVTVDELVRDAWFSLKPDLDRKPGLSLNIMNSARNLGTFIGEPAYLNILFVNMLDNAIKYSWYPSANHNQNEHAYEVKVYASSAGQSIDISIENWGIGISEEDYQNIFLPLYRSRIRDSRHGVAGVGLGLPTCKRIARMHAGDIWVKSTPTLADKFRSARMEGYRTVFTVRLSLTLPRGLRVIDLGSME